MQGAPSTEGPAPGAEANAPLPAPQWERAFPARRLGRRPGDRVAHTTAGGRRVTVLRLADGALACIDTACFHTGGPLGAGDLEELAPGGGGPEGGARSWHRGRARSSSLSSSSSSSLSSTAGSTAARTCLVCPWHHYRVDVRTGEGMYLDLEGHWQSKGVRQRVHDVEIRTAGAGEVAPDEAGEGSRGLDGVLRGGSPSPPSPLPSAGSTDVYAYGLDALVARMQAEQERKKAERLRQGR
ncbi:hypothetical protein MMPV_009370 [Pyropia vietnamensis]